MFYAGEAIGRTGKKRFFEELMEVEYEISHIEDVTRVDDVAGKFLKYLRIGKGLKVKRKNNSISRRLSTMGRTILFSNSEIDWDDALGLYRSRDSIEKGFRYMKTDLGTLPMGVQGEDTVQGYLLVQFLALILEAEMRWRLYESPLKGKIGIRETLMELSKLRMVKQGNAKYLTEITKRQREIFINMGIKEKDIVIK